MGAGYEFGPPLPADNAVAMVGGGGFGWEPGEWTDDTSMAIVIAAAITDHADLRNEDALDAVAAGWVGWAADAKDIGVQTSAVVSTAGRHGGVPTAEQLRDAARAVHQSRGRSGGNGSLMRTAPVALAFLDDEKGLVEAAGAVSAMTHFDPEAAEACVLWCSAIRHAVLTGELDVRAGLRHLPQVRRSAWLARIEDAEHRRPADFAHNGWVVEAFQGAWSAISGTPVPADNAADGTFRAQHLQLALEAAVRGGRDTDTVAAIAGGLLGAGYGASAVPARWRRVLHGWPGLRAHDLVDRATTIVTGRAPFDGDYSGYTGTAALARHPYDGGLWLGGIGALRDLPPDVDAVVSLCRIGPDDRPDGAELVEVRLIDRPGQQHNANLGFVLSDTVSCIEQLRGEGRTVLLHCVQAQSRTPTVAALYGARKGGTTPMRALTDIAAVLPDVHPIQPFMDVLAAATA